MTGLSSWPTLGSTRSLNRRIIALFSGRDLDFMIVPISRRCFPTFGKRYVIPVLASLAQHYPSLNVELDLTERLADPVAGRLDLVVRMGELQDSSLIATKLAPLDRIVVASQKIP